jgi:hypothetical protein
LREQCSGGCRCADRGDARGDVTGGIVHGFRLSAGTGLLLYWWPGVKGWASAGKPVLSPLLKEPSEPRVSS